MKCSGNACVCVRDFGGNVCNVVGEEGRSRRVFASSVLLPDSERIGWGFFPLLSRAFRSHRLRCGVP